jgi:hypothetical protein
MCSRHEGRKATSNITRARHNFQYSNWPQTRAECAVVAGNIFRTDRTGLSGRCESQSSALDAAKHVALLAAEHAVSDNLKRQ